ncbi:TMV resistance protein N, partial [Mucuna pruriens]
MLTKLAEPPINSKGLVGISEKIVDTESLIRKEPKDTRLVGIWGMGGIGKTTLAEEIFNKLRFEYEGCCFLANEREQSSRRELISLKEEIFSKLLGNVVKIDTPNSLPHEIIRRIRRVKILFVLDDVNNPDHLEKLLGPLHNFGSGSRIIVTKTRDEQVLTANKADEIYQLREFSFDNALELFSLNAFNQSDHQRDYDVLSERVVTYAKGVPLVLKVLGHLLCGKNKEVWESELDKLKNMPLTKVNVSHLKSLLKDGERDNSVIVGLERLKDKALITFSEDNFVCMHDSIQEMAWEIVGRENPKKPTWLWDPDDICEELQNDKNLVNIKELDLSYSKMLKELPDLSKATNFEVLLLMGCSMLTSVHPSIFSLGKLEKLNLLYCESLTTLTSDSHACNLSYLNLDCCKNLTKFSLMSENMKELILGSTKIKTLPSSFGHQSKLKWLDIYGSDIERLPSSLNNLTQLLYIYLRSCKELQTIPELPLLLETLDTQGCTSLQTIGKLPPSLKTLYVHYCISLQTLPELPRFLETLCIQGCKSLQTLPELPHFHETLNTQDCKSLQTLSKLPQPPSLKL